MNVIASDLEKAYPETNANAGINLVTLSQGIGRHAGNPGIYTGFMVGICILLIARARMWLESTWPARLHGGRK